MTSSLTPSLIWDVLSRLGPEDALMAVELPTNSSGMSTAGADFGIVKGPLDDSKLYYKDVSETQRFAAMVESDSPENRILRDLQKSRYLCAQPSFAMELCKRAHRAHQLKQCTPAYVEHLKCSIKLARAVDLNCRPQFTSFAACLKLSGNETAKCLPQWQAFDVCTESW